MLHDLINKLARIKLHDFINGPTSDATEQVLLEARSDTRVRTQVNRQKTFGSAQGRSNLQEHILCQARVRQIHKLQAFVSL